VRSLLKRELGKLGDKVRDVSSSASHGSPEYAPCCLNLCMAGLQEARLYAASIFCHGLRMEAGCSDPDATMFEYKEYEVRSYRTSCLMQCGTYHFAECALPVARRSPSCSGQIVKGSL
jgi:hypothetical protein